MAETHSNGYVYDKLLKKEKKNSEEAAAWRKIFVALLPPSIST